MFSFNLKSFLFCFHYKDVYYVLWEYEFNTGNTANRKIYNIITWHTMFESLDRVLHMDQNLKIDIRNSGRNLLLRLCGMKTRGLLNQFIS